MKSVALLFPGQGSQSPGMGRSLYDSFSIAKHVYEVCSEALGLDLKKLCFESSEVELRLTENTQPAILVTSLAALEVLKSELSDLKPSFTAGHSVGEYAALVASEVLDMTTAIRAVRARGQAMQAAVPVGMGGMVAGLGLNPSQAEVICREINAKFGPNSLSPANFNAPGQIVLSGKLSAIDSLNELTHQIHWSDLGLEAPKRLRWIKLEVSAPFHSPLMLPAEQKMREFFKDIEFKTARIPVVQNLTSTAHTQPEELKENLLKQVSSPVRWEESMKFILRMGCLTGIELGHGQVLKGLLKKTLGDEFSVINLETSADLGTAKKYWSAT